MLNTDDIRHHTEVGTGYSKDAMLTKAADEIDGLRATMIDLLEILRQWEPDNSSGKDRRTIMLAMYQIGVLRDPTETVSAMKVGAGGTATHNADMRGLSGLPRSSLSMDGLGAKRSGEDSNA